MMLSFLSYLFLVLSHHYTGLRGHMPQQLTLHTEEFGCLSLSSYQKLRGELYWPQFPPSHMGARKDFVPGLLGHLLMSYVSSTETCS